MDWNFYFTFGICQILIFFLSSGVTCRFSFSTPSRKLTIFAAIRIDRKGNKNDFFQQKKEKEFLFLLNPDYFSLNTFNRT
jgi:hypothetical protein